MLRERISGSSRLVAGHKATLVVAVWASVCDTTKLRDHFIEHPRARSVCVCVRAQRPRQDL